MHEQRRNIAGSGRTWPIALVLTLAACPQPGGDDGGDDAEESSDTETDTGASFDNHGTVRIEVSPLAGDLTIFDGTAEVRAIVNYQSCLTDFYLGNPGWQPEGVDGASVFAAFTDMLCGFELSPDCSVNEIQQTLLEGTDVYTLSVSYAVADPASLAYAEISVGPLPALSLTVCTPEVELRQNGLAGYDDQGTMIWRISTLGASNVAKTDQGAPLRVEVVRQ